jgi:BirA family transcriptional regulator, biotin operon repressor / biotin---[acetyl-CoA-carboxylase] ligase
VLNLSMQLLQDLAAERALETGARRFVSGTALATRHDVTRSAIWKAVGQLRELGAIIEAVPHRGYRLAQPSSPLDADGVRSRLAPATAKRLRTGECAGAIVSTNSVLLERGAPPAGRFDFLTAEHQSAGRGRRGRSWLAPPGGAICLSWSWRFEALAAQIGALSLAVGVAARRALAQCGVQGIGLKWPNDLVTAQGKLGGILIEMRAEAGGPMHVVAGLGLNVALDPALSRRIGELGQAPADLAHAGLLAAGTGPPARNALVAALLDQQVAAMLDFGEKGLAPFLAEFKAADELRGRQVQLQGAHAGFDTGTACGIAADGALQVEHDGRIHRIIAGEVSVRGATT